MVSGQFCFLLANSKSEGGPVNQREGQIITEYLTVLVESRIECETTQTSTDILTEKGLTPWTKAKISNGSKLWILDLQYQLASKFQKNW